MRLLILDSLSSVMMASTTKERKVGKYPLFVVVVNGVEEVAMPSERRRRHTRKIRRRRVKSGH